MLYDNPTITEYLLSNKGKLIHMFGEPDAGRTRVLFSLIDRLTQNNGLCGYCISRDFQLEVFQQMVRHQEQCMIAQPENKKQLTEILKLDLDYFFIDNFLEYIIHKSRKQIQQTFAILSARAYQDQKNIILVNDMRYHPDKGLHPAYQEWFYHFCAQHIKVEKDSDFNIRYEFVKL